jgi:hypothetical protein
MNAEQLERPPACGITPQGVTQPPTDPITRSARRAAAKDNVEELHYTATQVHGGLASLTAMLLDAQPDKVIKANQLYALLAPLADQAEQVAHTADVTLGLLN